MKIADNWSEVSLKQYIEIFDIMAIDMDELDKQVKIVSILSNEPETTVLKLSTPAFKQAVRVVSFIYTKPDNLYFKPYLRIGLKRFKVNYLLNTIKAGEYIDLVSYCKDQKEVHNRLSQIIAIFLEPVNIFGFRKSGCYENGCQTLDSRNKTAKLIEDNLMMNDVFALSGFFLKSYNALIKATLDYSDSQMTRAKKLMKRERYRFKRSGGG